MRNNILSFKCAGLVLAGLAAVLAAAAPDSGLEVHDRCRRDYRIVTVDGQTLESSSRRMFEPVEFSNWLCRSRWQGREVYIMKREEKTARGDHVYWDFIMNPENFSLIHVDKVVVTREGRQLLEERHEYEGHFYPYPANTYHFFTLPVAVNAMDLKPGARNDCYFIFSPEMTPWHVWLVVEGEEAVTVPAGTFECLKIKIEINYEEMVGRWGAIGGLLLKSLMPDYHLWVEKEPPHAMVRMQGKFGPPGASPEQAQELIKIHPNQDGEPLVTGK